uniref:Ribosomal protein L5 n=1 Tax=Dictyopteris divaricata TaxID=156996 RepID=A0A4Y5T8Y0_9PHAE|nr:ribosomal protein L5 [Dictyopteris divaricata]QDB64122.1 ribosomal protein L5 [Dictyopteris divaricata]
MLLLKYHYQTTVKQDMVLSNHIQSVSSVPSPVKITISMVANNNKSDDLKILSSIVVLECLGNQKPYLVSSKKVNFKRVIGGKLTMRNKKMYDFLFRALFEIFPNIKQFEGLDFPCFDNVFSFTIRDLSMLERISFLSPNLGDKNHLSCQIHFSTKTKNELFFNGRGMFFGFK